MSRELRRDILAELLPATASESSFLNTSPHLKGGADSKMQEDWQILQSQFDLFKRRFKELEANQLKTQTRMNEWMESCKTRFDRFNCAGSRMEKFLKDKIHEINEKFAHLSSRIIERRLQESKIQEMMDRHNQVLQSYEVRIGQIQKLVNDQQIQLMSAKAALEESRREITRLKKS